MWRRTCRAGARASVAAALDARFHSLTAHVCPHGRGDGYLTLSLITALLFPGCLCADSCFLFPVSPLRLQGTVVILCSNLSPNMVAFPPWGPSAEEHIPTHAECIPSAGRILSPSARAAHIHGYREPSHLLWSVCQPRHHRRYLTQRSTMAEAFPLLLWCIASPSSPYSTWPSYSFALDQWVGVASVSYHALRHQNYWNGKWMTHHFIYHQSEQCWKLVIWSISVQCILASI